MFKSGKLPGKPEFKVAFIVDRDFKAHVIDFKPVHEKLSTFHIKANEEIGNQTKKQFFGSLNIIHDVRSYRVTATPATPW